jgi:GntR family transcriptional regulator / MocR family aminotransferase
LTTGTTGGFSSKRLADALRTRIEDGRLQPGMLLPPYDELAQYLGVGAAIVQMAYIRLASMGRLLLKQDSGAQVAPLEM